VEGGTGKTFLGKLTLLADLWLKCRTDGEKLKNNISGGFFPKVQAIQKSNPTLSPIFDVG